MDQPTGNMNINDRLAEKIRNSELGDFFAEEDLHDLAKLAIKNAFFVETHTGFTKVQAPVVEIVRETFEQEFRKIAVEIAKDLVGSEENQKMLHELALQLLPRILLEGFQQTISHSMMNDGGVIARNIVEQALRERGF